MIPLYTEEEYQAAKPEDEIPLQCLQCGMTFHIKKRFVREALKPGNRNKLNFCGQTCHGLFDRNRQEVVCKHCGKTFLKFPSQCTKSPNHFCSHSCSCTYQNAHKTKGTRRSKLEAWLEAQLVARHPELEFHFNRKDAIDSELDIYIPSLKLAFELNGIFHYEPIYGADKLDSINRNDQRKFVACHERGISLCIVDTSKLIYFKEKNCLKYLDIIEGILQQAQNQGG